MPASPPTIFVPASGSTPAAPGAVFVPAAGSTPAAPGAVFVPAGGSTPAAPGAVFVPAAGSTPAAAGAVFVPAATGGVGAMIVTGSAACNTGIYAGELMAGAYLPTGTLSNSRQTYTPEGTWPVASVGFGRAAFYDLDTGWNLACYEDGEGITNWDAGTPGGQTTPAGLTLNGHSGGTGSPIITAGSILAAPGAVFVPPAASQPSPPPPVFGMAEFGVYDTDYTPLTETDADGNVFLLTQ